MLSLEKLFSFPLQVKDAIKAVISFITSIFSNSNENKYTILAIWCWFTPKFKISLTIFLAFIDYLLITLSSFDLTISFFHTILNYFLERALLVNLFLFLKNKNLP